MPKLPPPPAPKAALPPPPVKQTHAAENDLSDEEATELVRAALIAQGKDPRFAELGATPPSNEPEAGFVNPERYAPEQVAVNPEQAAEHQGIKKPEPKVEVQDDLNGMNRDQLKAVGVAISAFPENTRMRDPALRDAIRARRKELGAAVSDQLEVQAGFSDHIPALGIVQDEHAGVAAAEAEGQATPVLDEPFQAAKTVYEHKVSASDTPALPPKPTQLTVTETPTKIIYEAKAPGGRKPFTLYVNCAPRGAVLGLPDIINEANERLFATHKDAPREWGFIPYTASAELRCAVQDLIEEGKISVDAIVIDSTSLEGGILLNTLVGLAAEVVRAF
jgi:hypothetical protein